MTSPEAALLDASCVFYSTLQQLRWLRADHRSPSAQPFTPIVGREHEVAEISALLRRPEVRLLTITGTGGVGKTRVALAVASALLNECADGVCLLLLAPVNDPTLGSMLDSITRVFPPVSQVLSALCPGMTGFQQLSSYRSVRRCSPWLGTQRVPSVPESGSKHDWRPSLDR